MSSSCLIDPAGNVTELKVCEKAWPTRSTVVSKITLQCINEETGRKFKKDEVSVKTSRREVHPAEKSDEELIFLVMIETATDSKFPNLSSQDVIRFRGAVDRRAALYYYLLRAAHFAGDLIRLKSPRPAITALACSSWGPCAKGAMK